MNRTEFLVTSLIEKSPPLTVAREIQIMTFSSQANLRVKDVKKRIKDFVFS